MAHRRRRPIAGLVAVLLAVLLLVVAVVVVVRVTGRSGPLPGEERCVAKAAGNSVAVDLEQAHYASIIAGLSVKRGLAPRAASIAMATAYQESGIRNLDYGDRDSVGLFQQRPSQGWGTVEQLTNPYYSTGKFYDALVKIKGWQTDDITTIAQRIQISGYPDAYRDHERDGRILASALTGQSSAAISCLVRSKAGGDPAALKTALQQTFGLSRFGGSSAGAGSTVTVAARGTAHAWAYAQFAVANAGGFGISKVAVDGRSWTSSDLDLPAWVADPGADQGSSAKTVVITLR